MQCPSCQSQILFGRALLRGAHCKECGSMLFVAATYSRVLAALAIITAEALLWVGGVRKFFYPALGVELGFFVSIYLAFPVAFLILTVLVRTVPRFVPPHLVSRQMGTVTTLGLSPCCRLQQAARGSDPKQF
jgi:uncharacterized protein (DUF983 family)